MLSQFQHPTFPKLHLSVQNDDLASWGRLVLAETLLCAGSVFSQTGLVQMSENSFMCRFEVEGWGDCTQQRATPAHGAETLQELHCSHHSKRGSGTSHIDFCSFVSFFFLQVWHDCA